MNLNGVNSVGFVFEMVNLAMNHIFYSTKMYMKKETKVENVCRAATLSAL